MKLEDMDGEENPVDMRNVFPHNTANKMEKSTNIFKGAVRLVGIGLSLVPLKRSW